MLMQALLLASRCCHIKTIRTSYGTTAALAFVAVLYP
jgi:hypothetical protein